MGAFEILKPLGAGGMGHARSSAVRRAGFWSYFVSARVARTVFMESGGAAPMDGEVAKEGNGTSCYTESIYSSRTYAHPILFPPRTPHANAALA